MCPTAAPPVKCAGKHLNFRRAAYTLNCQNNLVRRFLITHIWPSNSSLHKVKNRQVHVWILPGLGRPCQAGEALIQSWAAESKVDATSDMAMVGWLESQSFGCLRKMIWALSP